MCGTCGCDADEHAHDHPHANGHGRRLAPWGRGASRAARRAPVRVGSAVVASFVGSAAEEPEARRIRLEHNVLEKNERLARENRVRFESLGVLALNFVSSPGSGKTTVLERTIAESGLGDRIVVIQGDQATDRDAERIRRAGARAVQINTGTGCHLDAAMVARSFEKLLPAAGSILAIENVGNLVCPALFDLGEAARIAIISTTEGDEKPLKYPFMFRSSELVLVNKLDLLEHVDFSLHACAKHVREVNPYARVLPISARTGEGLASFYAFLRERLEHLTGRRRASSVASDRGGE